MATPFIKELKQFALAIDIVNDTVLKEIEKLLNRYFLNSLQADTYEVRVPARSGTKGEIYLETLWISDNTKGCTSPLYHDRDRKTIRGHTSYSVIHNKPLWIVEKDHNYLKPDGSYIDLWSDVTDLPAYRDWGDLLFRTSIIVPFGSPPIGFLNVEFKRLIEPSSSSQAELKEVAATIEIFYGLYLSRQIQTKNTEKAVQNINVTLSRCPLDKRSLFFAFSKNADPEVVGIIKDELSQISDIRIVNWDEIYESGNIHAQMRKEILGAEYAVCYFSEPTDNEDSEILYVDNPNVVFESGMFHALTSDPNGRSNWIPIREEKSTSPPFDFAADRLLIVKRTAQEKLDEKKFRVSFKRRLESLIQDL